jgi:hypothetical protein
MVVMLEFKIKVFAYTYNKQLLCQLTNRETNKSINSRVLLKKSPKQRVIMRSHDARVDRQSLSLTFIRLRMKWYALYWCKWHLMRH